MTFSLQANYTDWVTVFDRRILALTFADRGVSRGQRDGSQLPLISVFYSEAAISLSSRSSFILMRLTGPRFRHTAAQKIW
jgi:hypothetical protein